MSCSDAAAVASGGHMSPVQKVRPYDPTGPFGAKGVGEPTSVPTAAAIHNAICDAVGVRISSLPATAEKVLAAIKARPAQNTKGRCGIAEGIGASIPLAALESVERGIMDEDAASE